MALTITARVPAELRYRDLVGQILREVCRYVERAEDRSGLEWRLVTAFNEAFNNVVEHGYEAGRGGEVSIVVTAEAARLVLEVLDDGCGFDFATASSTDPGPVDVLDAGGMGLFIMRNAVSDVRYERGAPNRLTLIQNLSECRARDESVEASNDEGSRC